MAHLSDALHFVTRRPAGTTQGIAARARARDRRGRRTTRRVEPQFLYLSSPIWYLLASDELREDVRSFRIDRIRGARVDDAEFRLRDPQPFLDAVAGTGEVI